jgi:hypothetical protein
MSCTATGRSRGNRITPGTGHGVAGVAQHLTAGAE